MIAKRQLLLRTMNEEIFSMVSFKALEPRFRQSKLHLLPYTSSLPLVIPVPAGTEGTQSTGGCKLSFQCLSLYFDVQMYKHQHFSSYLTTSQQVAWLVGVLFVLGLFVSLWVFFWFWFDSFVFVVVLLLLLLIAVYQSSEVTQSAMEHSFIYTFSEYLNEIVGTGGRARASLIRFQVLLRT